MSTQPILKEGTIDFPYRGETFQTYYKLYGSITVSKLVPLIVLHGGPGFVHNYLDSHSKLAAKYDIPVILYDQIGNGRSTHLKEKAPEFWTIDLFIEELENLINYFGIQDRYNILGHSWGGILASEFEVRRQPPGLMHLILANSLAAYSLWTESVVQLLQNFPEDIQEGVKGGMKDLEKFRPALRKFHEKHGCIAQPFPQELSYSLAQAYDSDGDPTVIAAPILEDWTIIDRLHLVRPPTFIINGRMDIAQDFVVKPFFDKIPRVKWVTLDKSSHTPFFEEPDRYTKLVGEFLIDE